MDRCHQITLIRAAAQEAALAQAILIENDVSLEDSAVGRLSRAVEDLCQAFLGGVVEEERARAEFFAMVNRD